MQVVLRSRPVVTGSTAPELQQTHATAMTVDRVHGTAASHHSHPPSSPPSSSSTSSRSSKSPQTTTTVSSPQHFGDGVFLHNCRLSADCLQLRTDPRSSPKPVRLYLTSTELVVRRKRTEASKAVELERDYSVLRYPLEDTNVSESVVSPRTLVVSIASSPKVEKKDYIGEQSWSRRTHRPNTDETFEANGDTSCTCSKPHIHCRESGAQEDASNGAHSTAAVSCNTCKCIASTGGGGGGEGGRGSRVRRNGSCRLVIVEAFQLCSDDGSVDEWISSVERAKHKLSLLARKANSSRISSTASPRTATQPSKVPSVSQRDSRRSVLSRLHPHADMAYTYTSLSSPSSPASERRRWAMAYRNPLKSSSPLTLPRYSSSPATHQDHYSDVRRRGTQKLFRRFSFTGSPSLNSLRGNLKETTQGETSEMLYTTASECQGGRERHEVCSSIETTPDKLCLQTKAATKCAETPNGCSSMQNSPLLSKRPGFHTHTIPRYCTPKRGIPRSLSYDQSDRDEERDNRKRLPTDDGFSPQLEHLKALISSLQPPPSPPSSPPPPSHSLSPSPPLEGEEQEEEERGSFKSLLRHKQIRGTKCHVSPRAFGTNGGSESARSSVTSPPIWMGRYARAASGASSTLPHSSSRSLNRRGSRDVDSESAASTPNSTATLPKRSKTPKIFRRIHRRWQSSSGVKLEHDMMDGILVTPEKSLPEKLYLMPAKEVAVGLTGMDGEMLERIGPQEIEGGSWMKKGEKERLAPNVLGMVHSFNQLALLVPTEILEEKTHQQRAKVISAYIQIATKCYYLKNYNSLKAILSGLQSTPIYRLKRTWKEVPSKRRKRFNRLCKLMSEEDNWNEYRSDLASCLLSSTPCIPYLGQFLTQVCHQLSYQQMRESVKKENESKRRSSSFGDLLLLSDVNKEKLSRKRSGSFHQNSPMIDDKKRASMISLSAPTSPLESDGENDENSTEMTGIQIPEMKPTAQSRRLGLSHSVDETSGVKNSSQIRFLANQRSIDTSESSLDSYRSRNTDPRLKFHSTPVKDLNGYIRPSQLPMSSNTSFDEASGDHGFDEIDFGTNTLDSIDTSDLYIQHGVDTKTVAADEHSKFHSRIPSISLQETASQNSLEKGDREGEEKKWACENRITGNRMIKKSRSLEFSLDNHTRHQSSTDLRQTICNIMAPLHQLSIAHSCASFDSDSVFSVDDREEEAEEEDEEEKDRRKHVHQQEEDDPLLGVTIDISLSDMSSQYRDMFTQSLPIPVAFSPTLQPPPKRTSPHFEESREEEEEGEESRLTPSQGECSRKETSTQPVRRSKSVGSSTIRQKWRRKKRVRNAAGTPSTTTDTVTSSDPQELLQLYQRQCREYYPSSVCQVDFRTLLASYNHNTETRNYELSFTREP